MFTMTCSRSCFTDDIEFEHFAFPYNPQVEPRFIFYFYIENFFEPAQMNDDSYFRSH